MRTSNRVMKLGRGPVAGIESDMGLPPAGRFVVGLGASAIRTNRQSPRQRPICVVFMALFLCAVPGQDRAAVAGVSVTPRDAGTILHAFQDASVAPGLTVLAWDEQAVRAAAARSGRYVVERFPLRPDLSVDLVLEPFRVTSQSMRFVLGHRGGPDRTLNFDAGRIALFRGRVVGHPGSHVFLALSDSMSTGLIDLGAGAGKYRVSSKGARGQDLAPGWISVFAAVGAGAGVPGVPLCGIDGHAELRLPGIALTPGSDSGVDGAASDGSVAGTPAPRRGVKHLELAVETDFEFFSLFGDADLAATYLVEMYAQVSDIFMRDVDTRVELVFARIWDQPDDLFNDVDPTPLFDFQDYWNVNMTEVSRDAAQLLSGRRDYPFGGQAYLSALCGSSAYSVVGYAMGFFPDPTMPSPYHYDIAVTSHELGHNSGTGHTHDSPNFLDTCNDPQTTPQRGPIMSYCGQTWSGLNANRDLYFHTTIQQNMWDHITGSSCVVDDCNLNSRDDTIDILFGTSADTDANGIPDECEDCNNNGTLDDADIAGGSPDLNANGIPDECEPDCNSNTIPDDKDIGDGTSLDLYGNGIPDECEPDCNSNGTSDFSEIQVDMPLDVDRNTILDSCQDCDTDGTVDFDALAGSHNLWIASGLPDSPVREFYSTTGVLTRTSSGGLIGQGLDLIVAPGGRVLVPSVADDRVMEFDLQGSYVGDLVPTGAGGMDFPTALLMTPGGTLLVACRNTNSVLAYDGSTGASLGEFVSAGSGGLIDPFGMTFSPAGNLLVASGTNEVIEYDGLSGSLVRVFVSAADNGGLDQPKGMTFKPDGNLLVASYGTDEVLEYDGVTGTPLGKWAQVGTATRLTQDSPWGIRVGPNGNVFVVRTGTEYSSGGGGGGQPHDDEDDYIIIGGRDPQLHLTNAQMYEFDVRTGNFVRSHIGGNDHGLLFPTGFDFVPGWQIDCNLNMLPDSCDIASGYSEDGDASGVPDECEIDCNANGTLDRLDIIPLGTSFDCNGNLVPDECDIAGGLSQDINGNGRPDECEQISAIPAVSEWGMLVATLLTLATATCVFRRFETPNRVGA